MVAGLAIAIVAIAVSSALNREVSKRLATVPPSSTSPTTTIVAAAPTPVPVPQVMGARVRRPSPTSSTSTSTTLVEAPPAFEADTSSELIAELEKLAVEDEHTDGYRRGRFGFYKDPDRDNCDTREEVVIAEATDLVMHTPTCTIQSGTWLSLFDGQTVNRPDRLKTTHLVSLEETWESGAWMWDDRTRNAYLNDLEHAETLLAVSIVSADERDGKDPGSWLPSNEDYRCDYLKTWVYLKTLYKLSVDPGERESIAAAALRC